MSNSTPRELPRESEPDAPSARDIEDMQDNGDTATGLGERIPVGDELRMRREELGHNIGDVVDAVRIQKRYLEALEEGRTADLPGTVYALGFVRTYADFLGLDGADMVARYKEETKTYNVDSTLVLPEPIDEGKVPRLAILLFAVVLSAAAYGAWYYLTQTDATVVEATPDVPDRLAGLIEEEKPAAAPRVTAPPRVTEPPLAATAPVESTEPTETAAPPEPAPPPITEAPVEPESPAEPVEAAVAEAEGGTPVETLATTAEPAPPPQPEPEAEVAPVTDTPPPAEAGSSPFAMTALAPLSGSEEPPSAPLEAVNREPRVYGLSNTNARIVVRAIEDAWVEVTDVEGVLLFSRVLRKGDSYRVANREGSTFVTGNAGGLELVVDGQAIPPIGPAGVVRRGVRLEPDLLKAGTAVP